MNYDPVGFCFAGNHIVKKADLEYIDPKRRRLACPGCRERIEREREKAKQRAKGARS